MLQVSYPLLSARKDAIKLAILKVESIAFVYRLAFQYIKTIFYYMFKVKLKLSIKIVQYVIVHVSSSASASSGTHYSLQNRQ
jgi:hypothetical protein